MRVNSCVATFVLALLILFLCTCRFVYVWDAVTQRLEYKLPGHLGSVNDVHFHPNEPISESKERGVRESK